MRSPFGRKSSPPSIHPGEWPAQAGGPRVLIENADRADLWAQARILREAGYEVAMCSGPTAGSGRAPWFRRLPLVRAGSAPELGERTVCPLVAEGHCPLVEGADVVVSTSGLTDGREILTALGARRGQALVVEGTVFDLERARDVAGDAVELKFPVTPRQLVDAVERAQGARAAG